MSIDDIAITDVSTGTTMSGHGVVVRDLVKEYTGEKRGQSTVRALDNINLEVHDAEFLVLLGPSGCGKSTLLRAIAGLETPQTGSISIGDSVVFDSTTKTNVSPDRRPMSMIFQSYALWPHMTAAENVAYPLECQRVPKEQIKATVADLLERLGLGGLASRLPAEMSGGQQQRLALARALVGGSGVVLFDEPLSNVDAVVRERLRLEMSRMQRDLKFTAIYVTHDQDEAMQLADRVAVMVDGRIQQIDTPERMYVNPANAHVASFIGQSNQVSITVTSRESDFVIGTGPLGAMTCRINGEDGDDEIGPGAQLEAFGRPSDFKLTRAAKRGVGADKPNTWIGQIETARFHGTHVEYVVAIDGVQIRCWRPAPDKEPLLEGDSVVVQVEPSQLLAVTRG